MIMQALIEGVKSVAVKSLTNYGQEEKKHNLVSIILITSLAAVTFVLSEIFFGIALYKILNINYNFSLGVSILFSSFLYIFQLIIAIFLLRNCLTEQKVESANVISKDYNMIKGIIRALILGFKNN